MPRFQLGQVVRTEIGDDTGGPKGARRWVLGSVTAISMRSGEYGNLITVDVFPENEGTTSLVKRYDGASRISEGDLDDAHNLAHARRVAQANGQASLTTQTQAREAQAFKEKCAKVQSVNLRSNTSGKGRHSDLTPERLGAIFQHPQVQQEVNRLFLASTEELQGALAKASADNDLLKTSLQSCDHERRQLLQTEQQLLGKANTFKEQRDRLQLQVNAAKAISQYPIAELAKFVGERGTKGFILWNPSSVKPPQVTYPTMAEAVRVQEIMAKRVPNQPFYICPVGPGLKLEVIPATHKSVAL